MFMCIMTCHLQLSGSSDGDNSQEFIILHLCTATELYGWWAHSKISKLLNKSSCSYQRNMSGVYFMYCSKLKELQISSNYKVSYELFY